jgi:hypothetical protein
MYLLALLGWIVVDESDRVPWASVIHKVFHQLVNLPRESARTDDHEIGHS